MASFQIRFRTESECIHISMLSLTEETPIISNIKAHFRIKPEKKPNLKLFAPDVNQLRHYHNFLVWRAPSSKFTYIIYFTKSFYVNVTGLRSADDIQRSICTFCRQFRLAEAEDLLESPTVDNITSSVQLLRDNSHDINSDSLRQDVDFESIASLVNSSETIPFLAAFNVQVFPGLFLKHTDKLGTVLLFHSGKINIVGTKCLDHIIRIHQEMVALMNKLY